jgi:peptidoglycan/xylan/chitin deacetylase (PgdA/CDA1 family)
MSTLNATRSFLMACAYFLFLNIFTSAYASEKVVFLTFDDDWKGQYLYVKPILEKYGFKGTFYVTCDCLNYQNSTVCNNSAEPGSVMTWEDVESLDNAGHDIQSHGMSHIDLTNVPQNVLDYEIGQSKQCLLDHNINSTVFANAYSTGWDNSTIINTVAKYYDMARNDYGTLTYLKCNEWTDDSSQTDCRTYFDNGTLTYANRYSMRTGDHNYYDREYRHNSDKILEDFIDVVNSQDEYNTDTEINAVPILVYHNFADVKHNFSSIDPDWINSTTDINLFDREMKYLYDNGFKVLTMDDLGYNKTSNYIYIKNYKE